MASSPRLVWTQEPLVQRLVRRLFRPCVVAAFAPTRCVKKGKKPVVGAFRTVWVVWYIWEKKVPFFRKNRVFFRINRRAWDNFVLLFAARCGMLTAEQKRPSRTDLIGPENGLLFPRGDEAAFAAAVRKLAADAGLRARMGQAGREKMQRYALDAVLPQVMEQYLSVTR